jgi:assimilatory nitrate reductase catalytic subunit
VCDTAELLQHVLPSTAAGTRADLINYQDAAEGDARTVAFKDGLVTGALYVSSKPLAIARSWLAEQLSVTEQDDSLRAQLLAGRSLSPGKDRGAIVCACFNVGQNEIAAAVRDNGCRRRHGPQGRHQLRLLPQRNCAHHCSRER